LVAIFAAAKIATSGSPFLYPPYPVLFVFASRYHKPITKNVVEYGSAIFLYPGVCVRSEVRDEIPGDQATERIDDDERCE
ncbi:MAG TPA: hypothetical protein VF026_00480, partial [Ktedonobacteraceae bacterium]